MMLEDCEQNRNLKIIRLNIADHKLNLHLQQIGFYIGSQIKVLKKSVLKKTMLIEVLNSCFAIKSFMAKFIEVEYA